MRNDMIKVKLLLMFFAIAITTSAQTQEDAKTVFGNGKPEIGYFVSPSCQFGNIAGSTAVVPGLGAGVVINDRIYVGINYKYIASENTPEGELDNRLYLDQKWIGAKFEYSINPGNVVHINFPIEFGGSEIELDLKDSFEDEGTVPTDDAWVAYVEPGVAIEINLHKYIKLNFKAGYCFFSDLEFRNLKAKDLSGMNYSIGFKMGVF